MTPPNYGSEDRHFHQVLRQARRNLEKCDEHIRASQETRLRMWKILAGAALRDMLDNREVAESFLIHADPKLRMAALCILRDHWKGAGQIALKCQQMALNDIDSQVQGIAVTSLGTLYADTNDPRVGKLLATILHDQSKDVDVRLYAYQALFRLRSLPTFLEPLWQEIVTGARFPENVDWSFVDSFLRS